MECSRCGGEAVVKRDNAVYCGKCALARDWEEVIHVVQADRLALDSRPAGGGPATKPDSVSMSPESVSMSPDSVSMGSEPSPAKAVESEPAPAASAPPADPFG